MITVVGRCIGARDDEQAVYYTRKLTVWSYIAMSLSNGAILLFLHKLIGIYALSGETMVLSELLVRIHAGFAILLWTLSFVLPNALRAANDVKFTMIVSILSMAVWRLGFSYLLCVRMGWGAVGVWIAMIIDWVCRVTCFVLRFRSGVWKPNIRHNIKEEYTYETDQLERQRPARLPDPCFAESFAALDADIFSVQETKMQPGQADFAPDGYTEYTYLPRRRLLRHGLLVP